MNLKTGLKAVFVLLAAVLVFISITGCYVLKRFGQLPSAAEAEHYNRLSYYGNGTFISPKTLERHPEKRTGGKGGLARFLFRSPNAPERPLPKEMLTKESFSAVPCDYAFYWLGHSSLIIELDGIRFMVDPVIKNAAPVPVAAGRYDKSPLKRKEIPNVDYVVISHDHYDHLEYSTVRYLRKRPGIKFIVPLGAGAHLRKWGVKNEQIHELGWGDSFEAGNVTVTAEKAIHYSGRTRKNRSKALWASYILKGKEKNIFISGDTGYGEIFKDIGEKYGPFDLAFVEIDGWNPGWPNTHLFPEEVMRLMKDVRANALVPTHWAVFDLALHPWDESIKMITELAGKENINVITPVMGEKVVPGITETGPWWEY